MSLDIQHSYEADRVETDKNGTIVSRELIYIIFDTPNETAAIRDVTGYVPLKYDNNLKFASANVEERVAPDAWKVRVTYKKADGDDDADEDDPNNYTFDTGSGTMHRDVAISHVGDYAPINVTPLDFGGSIGVDSDGNVGGVDVVMPQPGFSETVAISKKHFRPRYKRKLIRLTGKVNSKRFRGFEPGEVRFDGASATRNGEEWNVTFRFSVSENVERLIVGDIKILGTEKSPAKRGWDYLWFSYEDVETENASGEVVAVVRHPICAHVEQVYEMADFSELDIPKED